MTGTNLKDKLRSKTLGAKTQFKTEIIKIDGDEFEVRQPSIKSRSDMRTKCTSTESDGGVSFNMFEYMVWAVIENVYVPGTNDNVFEDTDFDALCEQPTGSFVDVLSEAAAKLMNVEIAEEKKSSGKAAKSN